MPRPAAGAKRKGHLRFPFLFELLPFPCFLIRHRLPICDRFENRERQSGYCSVTFSAFSQFTDSVLLHIRATLRKARHDSAAQFFCALYRKASANLGVGTVYLRRCRPSYSDERIARHCYLSGDLLLPFGQFTLCRACVDLPTCVAVRCL